MKCIVLAGGAGENMWPISRRNYPKQFVYLNKKHSLFQEAILRNMSFCDEFWIMSSTAYKNIIQGQLQFFSGLNYRCFFEEEGKMTAPSLLLACLCDQADEEFLVVSTDTMIGMGNYMETIVEGKRLIENNSLVCLGVKAAHSSFGVGFFSEKENGSVRYTYPLTEEAANELLNKPEYYLDTGILMGKTSIFIEELKKYAPKLVNQLINIVEKIEKEQQTIIIPKDMVKDVEPISIGRVLTRKSEKMCLLKGNFNCERIRSLESLSNIWNEKTHGKIIKNNCSNVSVMNLSDNKLVAANDLSDLLIVNTNDSVLVSKRGTAESVKNIVEENEKGNLKKSFEESYIYYTKYGTRETLQVEKNFWIRKVTVYPECKLRRHKHNKRSENWCILEGEAVVFVDNQCSVLSAGESILVERGVVHQLWNKSSKNLVFVETAVGEILENNNDNQLIVVDEEEQIFHDSIIKMKPVCKETIWGGNKLREKYGKESRGRNIAESWEVSAHTNGQSYVASGPYKGEKFGDYIEKMGKDILGWKGQFYDKFPLLVKFIDARDNLSVQVHPDDEYAMLYESQYGKNEMWYVMEAEPEACLYCGFKGTVTKEEVRERIEKNTLTDIMKKIPVKKGQTFFIPAGTVHAIGKGVLICEIQQNSDVTYRLYDYGRTDEFGNHRQLHIERAIDVLVTEEEVQPLPVSFGNMTGETICECKYFTVNHFECTDEITIQTDTSSFTLLVVVSGSGTIKIEDCTLEFKQGESFFVPAGNAAVKVLGNAQLLAVKI